MRRVDFHRLSSDERKAALQELADRYKASGFLAYANGQAIGWCSAGPREEFAGLENSRILKRVDDQPVWSIVCYYVAKPARRSGVMRALLRGVIDYAGQHGARIIEGYPIDMQTSKLAGRKLTGYSGFMGIASVFREVGFVEVGRASETQLIMRYTID
jgi:GNAT superfamily N-acetyltransferase